MTDPYLTDCVHCGAPAIECCIWRETVRSGGTVKDFCTTCIAEGVEDYHFGRCYECRDGYHERCIGVPCECPCPTPDQAALAQLRIQGLAKLTLAEQRALGLI